LVVDQLALTLIHTAALENVLALFLCGAASKVSDAGNIWELLS